MIIKNFENYIFKGSGIKGIKTSINISKKNDLQIILHEETQDTYEQVEDINTVKAFPPLVFSYKDDLLQKEDLENFLELNKIYLLDGHHRFEHISLFNYDYFMPAVLISSENVKIDSYNSQINIDEKLFIEYLLENNFNDNISSRYFVEFNFTKYSSVDIHNIYDLYDFKRKLLETQIISPIRNDSNNIKNKIINFTPIKLTEFNHENYLFPPKSTWISPRI